MKHLILIIIILLALFNTKASNLTINPADSLIKGNVTWNYDSVIVKSNVRIDTNATLAINAGCNVIFQGHYCINVKGTIIAEGTASKKIVFTAKDQNLTTTSGGWYGIRFNNSSSDDAYDNVYIKGNASKFSYCEFSYGNAYSDILAGFTFLDDLAAIFNDGGAIFICEYDNISIKHCIFNKNRANMAGGAISSIASNKINIDSCEFYQNFSRLGGAVSIREALTMYAEFKTSKKINITNNIFKYNSAVLDSLGVNNIGGDYNMADILNINSYNIGIGGGLSITNIDSSNVLNNTFEYNKANWGGAFSYIGLGTGNRELNTYNNINNNKFVKNKADIGGATYIYCNITCNMYKYAFFGEINNNIFSENEANFYGGGLYIIGGNTVTEKHDLFKYNKIISNRAVKGGGIFTICDPSYQDTQSSHSGLHIDNCEIKNNYASNSGGGLYCSSNFISFFRSEVSNNTAENDGGGLFNSGMFSSSYTIFSNNTAKNKGGAIADEGIGGFVYSSIFKNNKAKTGGAINSTFIWQDFTNNLLINNHAETAPAFANTSAANTFKNCIFLGNNGIHDNSGNIFKNCVTDTLIDEVKNGIGNRVFKGDLKNLFNDTLYYTLNPTDTFCIDKGNKNINYNFGDWYWAWHGESDTLDFIKNKRIIGNTIDIGPTECTPFVLNDKNFVKIYGHYTPDSLVNDVNVKGYEGLISFKYKIVSGNDIGLFKIDSLGKVRVTSSKLLFQNTSYTDSSKFKLEIEASFSQFLKKQELTVYSAPSEYWQPDLDTLVKINATVNTNNTLNWESATQSNAASLTGITWTTDIPKRVKEIDINYKNLNNQLNLSGLDSLRVLNCSTNSINSLNVTNNLKLDSLFLHTNQIASIDFTKNTNLVKLNCGGNLFTNLDFQCNTKLTYLNCSNQNMTNVDVSKNTALEYLYCTWMRNLTSLDISKNKALKVFHCWSDDLISLDISKNINLIEIRCDNNHNLTILDLTQNTKLRKLVSGNCNFKNLDLSNCPDLDFFDCGRNKIQSLNLTKSTKLTMLYCYVNQIQSLDVTKNILLNTIKCYNNNIPYLDLSQNSLLTSISCYENYLTFKSLSTIIGTCGTKTYSPQRDTTDTKKHYVNEAIDFSYEAVNINGEDTKFNFYKNDGTLVSTDNITGKYITSDTGTYYCTLTNAKYPSLTYKIKSIKVLDAPLAIKGTAFVKIHEHYTPDSLVTDLNMGNYESKKNLHLSIINGNAKNIFSIDSLGRVRVTSHETIFINTSYTDSSIFKLTVQAVFGTDTAKFNLKIYSEGLIHMEIPNEINEHNNNEICNLNIYPNPVSDYLNILYSIEKDTRVTIELFDMNGIKVKEFENETLASGYYKKQYNVQDLNAGVYVLRIKTDKKQIVRKIVK